jgi:hypothetical protein
VTAPDDEKRSHPIKRGFLGRAGPERYFNVGCLIMIIVLVVVMMAIMYSRGYVH